MNTLKLQVNIEHIDFTSEELTDVVKPIKKYTVNMQTEIPVFLDELHNAVMKEKGDWISLKYTESFGKGIAELNLIFHELDLDETNKQVLNKTVAVIEEKLASESQVQSECNGIFIEDNFKALENEGFILRLEEEGGSGELRHEDIENYLELHNIEFKRLYIHENRFEGGASGGNEEILYFIIGSVTSGITWDLIKGGLTKLLGDFSEIKIDMFDKINFNNLRKDISDKVRVERNDLILYEMYKNQSEIILVFKADVLTITVITDSKYKILDLKVE